MKLCLAIALVAAVSLAFVTETTPPLWLKQFTVSFVVKVEQYGPEWSNLGILYYNYADKIQRADFIDWCLPLEDDWVDTQDWTCSYVMRPDATYYIAPDDPTEENRCCTFMEGLAAPPPNWLDNCRYNGTEVMNGYLSDIWDFYVDDDLYYGYWSRVEEEEPRRDPVHFMGLSSVGLTTLDYFDYLPNEVDPPGIGFDLPTDLGDCHAECVNPFGGPRKTPNFSFLAGIPGLPAYITDQQKIKN